MSQCLCTHHRSDHRPRPASKGGVREGCMILGCECLKFVGASEEKTDTITPAQKEFARALVGQHQKVILKHRQMIDDIKTQFGLKE